MQNYLNALPIDLHVEILKHLPKTYKYVESIINQDKIISINDIFDHPILWAEIDYVHKEKYKYTIRSDNKRIVICHSYNYNNDIFYVTYIQNRRHYFFSGNKLHSYRNYTPHNNEWSMTDDNGNTIYFDQINLEKLLKDFGIIFDLYKYKIQIVFDVMNSEILDLETIYANELRDLQSDYISRKSDEKCEHHKINMIEYIRCEKNKIMENKLLDEDMEKQNIIYDIMIHNYLTDNYKTDYLEDLEKEFQDDVCTLNIIFDERRKKIIDEYSSIIDSHKKKRRIDEEPDKKIIKKRKN